jgi:NTE family protein
MAHVGVLRVLDDAGIRPDLVVGTSMGAVVGALYASGYTARQIDSLARTLPLADAFRTSEPRGPLVWGSLRPLVIWEEGEQGFALQGAAVNQSVITTILNTTMLRGNLIARGDFDRLPIPLRVVATDLANREVVTIAGGDLAQAVRASSAIPLVFSPEPVDGRVLVDGGLSANIPATVARDAGAVRLIVSDVTDTPGDSLDLDSPLAVASRLLEWLFIQPADSFAEGDLLVRSPIDGFGTLDFGADRVAELIALGEAAARQQLASWSCAPAPRPPLVVPVPPTRAMAIDSVTVDRAALRILRQSLLLTDSSTVDPAGLAARIADLGDDEIFREYWLRPYGEGDSVGFRPLIQRLPRRVAGIGLAYDADLGGRLWVGVVDRRLPVVHGEGSAVLSLSRFESSLLAEFRRQTLLGQPSLTPVARMEAADGVVRRFAEDGLELPGADHRWLGGGVGVERRFGWGVRVRLDGIARNWREADRLTGVALQRSTLGGRLVLDRIDPARRRIARLEVVLTQRYSLAAVDFSIGGRIGSVDLDQRVRIGIGHQLPAALSFTLGGNEGFPGLRIYERPGDNELFTSLVLSRRVLGSVSLRLTGAVGRSAIGDSELLETEGLTGPNRLFPGFFVPGDILGSEGWLAGARIGLGTDTPIGPIRVEWGFNNLGRAEGVLRVGRF